MMSELNCVVLDDTQITEALSKTEEKNGFEQVFQIMKDEKLLPKVIPKSEKCDRTSEQLWADGNEAYVKTKDNMEALRLYSKAICAACPDSKEMALAYANRSAVTYDLQKYDDSIRDIDRALSNEKYPKHLKQKLLERRGKCFMAVCQYTKALEDFNSAKAELRNSVENKVKSPKAQIDNLIQLCQSKPNKQQESAKILPKLSHRRSPYIKAASAAVDIKISPEMGRHLVAATNIKPGDVLAVETPYVSILLASNNYEFCHNCKKRSHSSIPCMQCVEVVYCSEKCRQDGWSEHHCIECDILPTLHKIFGDDNTNGYLALRILVKASKCGKNLDLFLDDYSGAQNSRDKEKSGPFNGTFLSDYTSVRELLTHEGSRSLQNRVQEEITAACIVHLLAEGTPFFQHSASWPENTGELTPFNIRVAARMIVMYCMICSCNAHEIEVMRSVPSVRELNEPKSFKIGSAVYPFHALMNHSCDPNVVRSIVGDKSYIFAVQPVQKGQEIFDSYKFLYTVVPLPARQKYFKEKYFFTCKCVACQQKWPTFGEMPNGPPKYLSSRAKEAIPDPAKLVSKIAKTMVDIGKGNISDEQFEFLSQYISLIHKNVQRPWKPYLMCLSSMKHFLNLKTYHLNN